MTKPENQDTMLLTAYLASVIRVSTFVRHSSFGISLIRHSSFGIRHFTHSSFVIRHFSHALTN